MRAPLVAVQPTSILVYLPPTPYWNFFANMDPDFRYLWALSTQFEQGISGPEACTAGAWAGVGTAASMTPGVMAGGGAGFGKVMYALGLGSAALGVACSNVP
jgi:hypothetical protein